MMVISYRNFREVLTAGEKKKVLSKFGPFQHLFILLLTAQEPKISLWIRCSAAVFHPDFNVSLDSDPSFLER